MIFRNGLLSRRDALLLLVGASSMHIWTLLFAQQPAQSDIFINTHVSHSDPHEPSTLTTTVVEQKTWTETKTLTSVVTATPTPRALSPFDKLPATELLGHAPGWTLFKNLYMTNGTLFIVAEEADRKVFPAMRMMTSTGLTSLNTPENIALREPLPENMQFITPKQARERWTTAENVNRVWTVEGNTLLLNDPSQFLKHYYHFVAEIFFGVQAFWHGAFSKPIPVDILTNPTASVHYSTDHSPAPPIHRAIFAHAKADGWRDNPGFDSYFLRAVYPSLIVEHQEDWNDRIRASQNPNGERAWHFPMLLLTDRSASNRGQVCGSTHRIAGEAWEYMRLRGKLHGIHVGAFWAPIREAMWRFAGATEGMEKVLSRKETTQQMHFGTEMEVVSLDPKAPLADPKKVVKVAVDYQRELQRPKKIVISYISRQSARARKLIKEDHLALVASLKELVDRKNNEYRDFMVKGIKNPVDKDGKVVEPPLPWELAVLEAEKMSKDAQIQTAARTTIMLGVHGNGLTHLVFMNPNRYSTVIELFFPKGFAHDYQWTARSLGMSYFPVWNDTYHIWPEKPTVNYLKGFQGNSIPVHGPTVAQLVEDRIAEKL
ncbi:hypothetical protein D9619_009331 [Psilocybe cf. subviscida]|uniref:Glycosyltransferase 61 catalytic domain-containing protein n=1 Tax=Psilocybe cf. subviscida TaxID=2480587 RepID=A0A8H5FAJ4_9AGAR|nr:hypothetical protein D9619_009331 [Psilocybe cf. subviscida]